MLRPGFVLLPLMFRSAEIEALMPGLRWVADRGDAGLAAGAREATTRIAAVLPAALRRELETSALLVGTAARSSVDAVGLELLRTAIRSGLKLRLACRDRHEAESVRVVWPFALVYFEEARVLAAWCESRADFRNFRADRIVRMELLDEAAPRSPAALLAEWRRSLRASGRTILPETAVRPSRLEAFPLEESLMKFASIRLVTLDVQRLATGYTTLSGVAAVHLADGFAEIRLPGATLAISAERLIQRFNAGAATAAANHSAILEFEVDEVDRVLSTLGPAAVVVQGPAVMPWGNRSLLLRDPDGSLVNVFSRPCEAAGATPG